MIKPLHQRWFVITQFNTSSLSFLTFRRSWEIAKFRNILSVRQGDWTTTGSSNVLTPKSVEFNAEHLPGEFRSCVIQTQDNSRQVLGWYWLDTRPLAYCSLCWLSSLCKWHVSPHSIPRRVSTTLIGFTPRNFYHCVFLALLKLRSTV